MAAQTHDAIVIGSGFGGSIAALRLAEAGRAVLVLERGQRYRPQDFPRDVRDVDALLWRYPEARRSRGLFELRFMSGVASVTASGVGGGSLIYANIHYRPSAVVFEDPRWPSELNLDSLEPYYKKVAAELGVEVVPPHLKLAKREVFERAAEAMGRPHFNTPQAVSWPAAEPGESRVFGADPNGDRKPCQLCAECEFGCPHGAKNTLDFTYLAKAEALGARIQTGRSVTHIAPNPAGGWTVHYEDTRSGEAGSLSARKVVLAAGTLGTNEILLRSRDLTKTLPKLPARLGLGYSGNGDFLGNIQSAAEELTPWHGPDVTTVLRCEEHEPGFVVATPTFNRPVTEVLAALGQAPPRPIMRLLAGPLYEHLDTLLPWALRKGLLSRPLRRKPKTAGPPSRFTNVFAIGRDNAGGRAVLRKGKLDIVWNYEVENRELVTRQQQEMARLARRYGGSYGNLVTWDLFRRPLTVHNLGGCAPSSSPDQGVVDLDGQIHGHPGLYVADGAVIPTSIGGHPVMTISAMAERIAERVAASYD